MSGKALHPEHKEFFEALGRRIRELRLARQWTLRDMVLLGYHVSQWQKFEKGCPVTVDSLLRLSTVFGITLAELFGDLISYPRRPEDKAIAAATPVQVKPDKAKPRSSTKTRPAKKIVRATTSK